jgi:hypothetical protein
MIQLSRPIAGQPAELPGSRVILLSVTAVGANAGRWVLAGEHVVDQDAREASYAEGQHWASGLSERLRSEAQGLRQ